MGKTDACFHHGSTGLAWVLPVSAEGATGASVPWSCQGDSTTAGGQLPGMSRAGKPQDEMEGAREALLPPRLRSPPALPTGHPPSGSGGSGTQQRHGGRIPDPELAKRHGREAWSWERTVIGSTGSRHGSEKTM